MNTGALFYRASRVCSYCCHVQLKRCKILLLLEGRDLVLPFPSDLACCYRSLVLFRPFEVLFEFTK